MNQCHRCGKKIGKGTLCEECKEKATDKHTSTEALRQAAEKAALSIMEQSVVSIDIYAKQIEHHVSPVLEAAMVGMREASAETAMRVQVNHGTPYVAHFARSDDAPQIAAAIRALPLPTPSLDALRDEVIEECAKVADDEYELDKDTPCDEGHREFKKKYGTVEVADAIRALKGAKR